MSVVWKNKYATLSEPKAIFTVLIAAAGCGRRMGGVYKPLEILAGKPMLAYSLEAFETSAFVKQIVVSAPEERLKEVGDAALACGCTKLKCVTPGGATRAESVVKAFRAAFDKKEDITPFIAVHDAARPMVTAKIIDDTFFACTKYGAAVAAVRVRDALKRTGFDNVITEELERDGAWQMQTPQAFDTDIYHTALATLEKTRLTAAVDDGAIVSGAGFPVMCVESDFSNFKVTYPEDAALAQIILAARRKDAVL